MRPSARSSDCRTQMVFVQSETKDRGYGLGMPDGWEVQYGLNPLLKDALGDKDGDRYINLQEYKAGTDPTDRRSKPGPKAMPWLPLLLSD